MNYRYTVLTYIIGQYEFVKEIKEKDPAAEYILVTDDRTLTSSTWNIVYDESLNSLPSALDKCYSIRFNVFKYCHSPICIYADSNVQINKPLTKLVDIFEDGKYDMCLMPHPLRNDFFSEYRAWVSGRGYPAENAVRFFKMLGDSHYPSDYKGLF